MIYEAAASRVIKRQEVQQLLGLPQEDTATDPLSAAAAAPSTLSLQPPGPQLGRLLRLLASSPSSPSPSGSSSSSNLTAATAAGDGGGISKLDAAFSALYAVRQDLQLVWAARVGYLTTMAALQLAITQGVLA